jgi:hypothetical protein
MPKEFTFDSEEGALYAKMTATSHTVMIAPQNILTEDLRKS